jgi:hypothetical protein
MTTFADARRWTNLICIIALLCSANAAWAGVYQHGTIVRMRMGDCLPAHHGFITTFGGPQAAVLADSCPEYTLVSDKVVYVIVGKSSNQLVPLADVIDFRLRNNEMAVRLDDAKHETKFGIKEMVLRSEWEMIQRHIADQLSTSVHAADSSLALRTRQ